MSGEKIPGSAQKIYAFYLQMISAKTFPIPYIFTKEGAGSAAACRPDKKPGNRPKNRLLKITYTPPKTPPAV